MRPPSQQKRRSCPCATVTPSYIADHIRRVLKDGGSTPHSEDVQHFFKEVVQSRGWYTAELRKFARPLPAQHRPRTGHGFPGPGRRRAFFRPGPRRKSDGRLPARKTNRILATTNFSFSPPGSTVSAVGPTTTRWRMICWRPWSPPSLPAAARFSVGEVAESLAAASGVCGADSGARERRFLAQIVRLSNQLLQATKTIWCRKDWAGCCARRQGRSEAHRALPDEDSEECAATGAANRLRNAARCYAEASVESQTTNLEAQAQENRLTLAITR